MKKFLGVIVPSALCLLLALFGFLFLGFSSCHKHEPLIDRVSELRFELYEGFTDDYSVKAAYGYKEHPSANDGAIGNKVYALSFLLCDKTPDDVARVLTFVHGENTYRAEFKLNPANDSLCASVELADFAAKEFVVKIIVGSSAENVTLKSIIPERTITPAAALRALTEKQGDFLSAYKNEKGEFTGEISQRIIVKNEKPYWYVGIMNGKGGVKALLVDGINGEILAVREII